MIPSVRVEIRHQSFVPWQELEAWDGTAAASSVFLGRVRPTTMHGEPLDALELEHYPGLSEQRIEAAAMVLLRDHSASAVLVLHRVGLLRPGELIVLVAVQADRRGAAQRCSAALLEELKHEAPFWKREWCDGQGTWLSANTSL